MIDTNVGWTSSQILLNVTTFVFDTNTVGHGFYDI